MTKDAETILMSTSQTQFMNEIRAGHDGHPIPEAKRVYFQERFRQALFEFLLNKFVEQQKFGLSKAKLARRIGKKPDVINRWLGAPSNLTADTISDLLLGICAEEPELIGKSLLNRAPRNYGHLDEYLPQPQPDAMGAVKIKPLEWYFDPERPPEYPSWNATDAFGCQYRVFKAWWGCEEDWGFVYREFHKTEQAAKAAREGEYQFGLTSCMASNTVVTKGVLSLLCQISLIMAFTVGVLPFKFLMS